MSAWLLPSEWMDVNYGAALKSYLTQRVQLLRLHRFRPEDVQFGEALVTSSVLFFRHGAPEPDATVRLTSGSLSSPALDRRVPIAELGAAQKWGARFAAEAGPVSAEGPRLGELLSVRRGIATGANGFFVRPRSEFRRLGVADRFLRPAVPAPRDLAGGAISADSDGWPDLPDPPALLDVRLPEASLAAHPAIHALLTSAEAQEIRACYLCAHRSPWYLQEQRPPAAILASYMGRSRDGAPPIRFVRNRSDATPTNNWLLLSPTPAFIARYPDPAEREAALDRLCGWLSGLSAGAIVAAGRTYGGGLSKLEPK